MPCWFLCGRCAECRLLWTRMCVRCGDDYMATTTHTCTEDDIPELSLHQIKYALDSLAEGVRDLTRVFVDRDMGETDELTETQIMEAVADAGGEQVGDNQSPFLLSDELLDSHAAYPPATAPPPAERPARRRRSRGRSKRRPTGR